MCICRGIRLRVVMIMHIIITAPKIIMKTVVVIRRRIIIILTKGIIHRRIIMITNIIIIIIMTSQVYTNAITSTTLLRMHSKQDIHINITTTITKLLHSFPIIVMKPFLNEPKKMSIYGYVCFCA